LIKREKFFLNTILVVFKILDLRWVSKNKMRKVPDTRWRDALYNLINDLYDCISECDEDEHPSIARGFLAQANEIVHDAYDDGHFKDLREFCLEPEEGEEIDKEQI
jgi:hypothetical protein